MINHYTDKQSESTINKMFVKELPEVLSRVRLYKLYSKNTSNWAGNTAINLAQLTKVSLQQRTIYFHFPSNSTQLIEFEDCFVAEKEFYAIHHIMNQ